MASITRENPLKTSKEMPFIVSMFFLFIYISIFYVCSLSPSSVLHNSTFWFFLSNTLIFIIAVDYRAFSPPRQKLVVYLHQEYYQTHIQTKPIVSEKPEINHSEEFEEKENPENGSLKSIVENDPEYYQNHIQTKPIASEKPERNHSEEFEEKENPENGPLKSIVENDPEYYQTHIQTKPIASEKPERNHSEEFEEKEKENGSLKSIVENGPENPNEDSRENNTFSSEETTKNQGKSVEERKPEKVEREETIEETDPFAKMTDEELNRRVEEFIKKFNKQIRLQRIHENLRKYETV